MKGACRREIDSPFWRTFLGRPRPEYRRGANTSRVGRGIKSDAWYPRWQSARGGLPTFANPVANGQVAPKIGIGGHLAVPPLPHHRAYGSRTTAVRPG